MRNAALLAVHRDGAVGVVGHVIGLVVADDQVDGRAQQREQRLGQRAVAMIKHAGLPGPHEAGEYRGEARSSTTYYTFDPAQYLRVQREMDGRDEWVVVNYHSHTRSEAYPSVVDIELASGPASDPRIHYVIVSTRADAEPRVAGHELRAYRIVDGVVAEEDITVVESYAVESYMFAHTGADDVPDNS